MQKKKNNLLLIIDSNTEELRHLGSLIRALGEVIFATSAEAGLFMAQHRTPDLIICSLDLPDISGVEVCQCLKNGARDGKDSMVVITANKRDETQELAALQAGAVDFIARPYNAQVLLARITTHLNLARHKMQLQTLADRDGLTEVYNRRYFENQARVELSRHYRQQQALTLALLDIDHFKAFNDAYGHLQGDVCLREVAQAVGAGSRRPGEFVSRYGGEEFVVVLPNTNAHNAKKYGRWICQQVLSLAIPHAHSPTLPFVSISAGIVTVVPDASTTLENLIITADSALYLAKEAGRNQFKVATIARESIKEAG